MVRVYVLLIVTLHDSILFLKRQNVDFGSNLFALSGGECVYGETPTQAAIREAQEELGITISPDDLELVHTLSRNGTENNLLLLFFKVDKWAGEITNKEPHKHSELLWAPTTQLPTNIIPAHKQALEEIAKDKIYSEHGW